MMGIEEAKVDIKFLEKDIRDNVKFINESIQELRKLGVTY